MCSKTHQRAWSLNVDAALASGGETFEKKGFRTRSKYSENASVPANNFCARDFEASWNAYAAATRQLAGARDTPPFGWMRWFEVGAGVGITSKSKYKWGHTEFEPARGISIGRVIASAAAAQRLTDSQHMPLFSWKRCVQVESGGWPPAAKVLRKSRQHNIENAGAKYKEMAMYGNENNIPQPTSAATCTKGCIPRAERWSWAWKGGDNLGGNVEDGDGMRAKVLGYGNTTYIKSDKELSEFGDKYSPRLSAKTNSMPAVQAPMAEPRV
ncbi:hypothetical protein C8R43DRAFT_963204 [Mycena crocata]|nr:hypothetical protein C8R43DRAFT_963204 [Mycena crocata]